MKNKRNSPRFPVLQEVRFTCQNDEENCGYHIGILLTASPFGVFLKTDLSLHKDDKITVSLPLPQKILAVQGRVAWCKGEKPAGCGVEFQGLTEEDREAIMGVILEGGWLGERPTECADIFTSDTDDIISDLE